MSCNIAGKSVCLLTSEIDRLKAAIRQCRLWVDFILQYGLSNFGAKQTFNVENNYLV